MFTNDLCLPFLLSLVLHLTVSLATKTLSDDTTTSLPISINTTTNGNGTKMIASIKGRFGQGKEIIHNAFANMDRGTLVRGTIVLGSITCLVLMYIGLKTFL